MTFLLNAQRQNSKWNSLPPCHINDTTDVLKQAHIFLEFAYNDLPFAYSLLPFLQKYQSRKISVSIPGSFNLLLRNHKFRQNTS